MNNIVDKTQLQTSFDYEVLNLENRIVVQQRTEELKERLLRSAQDIWEIGQKLADVRSRLKHGQFDSWLKAEFGWSRRTAYNFINVYETFSERAKFAQINIATSALYLLASPSTPQAIRDEFLEQARTGEKVTYKEIRRAVSKNKLQPAPIASSTRATKLASSTPEVVTVVPKPEVEVKALVTEVQEPASHSTSPAITVTNNSQPCWYLLERQHLLFCGDTTSPQFIDRLPSGAIALGVTSGEWHHDWLINKAKAVILLQQSIVLEEKLIERLLLMFSKRGEAVIFPSLPSGQIIAVVHKLQRLMYTGDPSFARCSQAIAESGLRAERVNLL